MKLIVAALAVEIRTLAAAQPANKQAEYRTMSLPEVDCMR